MFKKSETQKIKSTRPQTVLRVLLIVFMGFVLLRGVSSILKPKSNDTAKAQAAIQDFASKEDYKQKTAFQAQAYAKMFITEYFTYDNLVKEDETYIQRLQKYTDMEFYIPQKQARSEVLNVEAYKTNWRGEKTLDVDCKVKVRYTVKQDPAAVPDRLTALPTPLKLIEDIYIRVPILESNSTFIVEGYPLFLPAEEKADVEQQQIKGKDVEESNKRDIMSMLESFLKVYCQGSSTEISYYLQNPKLQPKGLNNYTFKEIKRNSIQIKENDDGQYLVSTAFTAINANGIEYIQGIELNIIKKDNKYLINKYTSKI